MEYELFLLDLCHDFFALYPILFNWILTTGIIYYVFESNGNKPCTGDSVSNHGHLKQKPYRPIPSKKIYLFYGRIKLSDETDPNPLFYH